MACLNMLNNEQQGLHAPAPATATMGPRISFSSDFGDPLQPMIKHDHTYREAPVSSDNFEFSVSGYNMISADELFSKGKLLPVKTLSLRDQLLVQDDDDDNDDADRRRRRHPRWKDRFALKKPHHHDHVFPRKADNKNALHSRDETPTALSFHNGY